MIDIARLSQTYPELYGDIFSRGVYCPHDQNLIRGKTVFDIGANVGVFTIFALAMGAAKVIAVEPEPSNFSVLQSNCLGLPNVDLVNLAISDGSAPFLYITLDGIMSKCIKEPTNRQVGVITLADLVARYADGRDDLFLKTDCEQSEFEIFTSSSRETMRRFSYIAGEFHAEPNSSKYNISFITTYLEYLGFVKCRSSTFVRNNNGLPECCYWIENAHYIRA